MGGGSESRCPSRASTKNASEYRYLLGKKGGTNRKTRQVMRLAFGQVDRWDWSFQKRIAMSRAGLGKLRALSVESRVKNGEVLGKTTILKKAWRRKQKSNNTLC